MRIRSVRPEFWDNPVLGALGSNARLVFVASWNIADDEGLLRWIPESLAAVGFKFDPSVSLDDVADAMGKLVAAGFVFRYRLGVEDLGWVIKFSRHQKPNRPNPSRLSPPPLTDLDVLSRYADRDGWCCARCGTDLTLNEIAPSLVVAKVDGGTEHPKNIRVVHKTCPSLSCSVNVAVSHSVSTPELSTETGDNPLTEHSLSNSHPEGRGKGGEKEGRGNTRPRCPQHTGIPDNDPGPPCVACRDLRLQTQHPRPRIVPAWCGTCDEQTRLVEIDTTGTPARCPTCHPQRRAS